MLSSLFVKLGLSSLMIVASTGLALSDSKNYATQLELKNCGAYTIGKIVLQRKAAGDGNWVLVKEWSPIGDDLTNGITFCVDVSGYSQFKSGDQARLKAYIDAGDTQTCDGTNYGESKKPRRKMQMARDDYEDRRERQRQGIEQAKKRGKYKGRKADLKTCSRKLTMNLLN